MFKEYETIVKFVIRHVIYQSYFVLENKIENLKKISTQKNYFFV